MKLQDVKKKLIQENEEFRQEYFIEDLAFGISRLISNVRTYKEMSQADLSNLIETKQSGISRLEKGSSLPSISFLSKIAESLNFRIVLKFISKDPTTIFDSDGNVYIQNSKPGYEIKSETIKPYHVVEKTLIYS